MGMDKQQKRIKEMSKGELKKEIQRIDDQLEFAIANNLASIDRLDKYAVLLNLRYQEVK